MKILQQNSTHKAVQQNGRIEIFSKGLVFEDLIIKEEFLYSIPLEDKDDLFAIFERYDEDNRCNVAEFKNSLK